MQNLKVKQSEKLKGDYQQAVGGHILQEGQGANKMPYIVETRRGKHRFKTFKKAKEYAELKYKRGATVIIGPTYVRPKRRK